MKTEKDLENMDLPKANYYEQLETRSEQNFQILFDPAKFHLCTRDRRDKGLDITYELIRASNHIGFRFVVQLKSTESIEANKTDGSYSVSLETSNINYLLNNNCPAFYVLYEVNTNTFYYESITEFLISLDQKDKDWEKQASHVLRFSKKLFPEGITEMYETAQRIGLLQRNLIECATLISSSINQTDRISIGSDLAITDDKQIRNKIEILGFELINEGKWMEIIAVHQQASGNVASTGLYNLILGIANYYGGSRWIAKSFLKNAKNLKTELNEDLQKHLQYFDTTIDYSLGIIDDVEFNSRMQTLVDSDTIGLYVKLENAKRDYIDSMAISNEENYNKYVKEIEDIINHPNASNGLKLTAKCELILFQGFKNNSDYVSGIAKLNANEEFFGPELAVRIESAKYFIQTNAKWLKKVEETIDEAEKSKNNFAYFTALINEVKVSYQFNIYTSTIFVVKEIPGQPKLEMPDNKPILEKMLKRISLAADFFKQIGHIENSIAANSTYYEILHYAKEIEQANKVMVELQNIIENYDLIGHKVKLEHLKNGGTTHETFKKWFEEIFEAKNQKKIEHERMEMELLVMDEEERKINKKPIKGNYHIHLFPIGYFQFPISEKEKVYEILKINDSQTRENFDAMFKIVIPIANIFYPEIKKEGFQEGNLANRDFENWKNIYRVRKAFYENKFYRFEQ